MRTASLAAGGLAPPAQVRAPDMGLRALARRLAPAPLRRARITASFASQIETSGEAELAWLPQLVESGVLALDIGANAGVYAWALHRHGARVIAFEPNPALADIVDLVGNGAFDVRRIALSDSDGTATLTLPHDDAGLATLRSDAADAGATHFEVATARLDGLAMARVGFIKIDVEGHEERVLDGAMTLVARDLPVMLIEIEDRHNMGGIDRTVTRLAKLGYTAWFLVDGRWHPFADFDASLHQRLDAIAPMEAGASRRSCRYFNNFLFLPAGKLPPRSH